jgi:flagellar protein FliO/FliZ
MRKRLQINPFLWRVVLPGVVLVLFSAVANADDSALTGVFKSAARDSLLYERSPASSWSDLLFRIGSVTIMLALFIAGGYWVIRRYGGRSVFPGRGLIRVLARHHISPKQSILLINVEGRKLLIGSADHNINLLADLGAAPETENQSGPETPAGGFAGVLQSMLKPKT